MRHRLALRGVATLAVLVVTVSTAGCASSAPSSGAPKGFVPAYLTGSVTLADSHVQPVGGSHLRIRLYDVSRKDAPPALLAEQLMDNPRRFPAVFSLCHDAREVRPGQEWELDGGYYVDGELRYMQRLHLDGSDIRDKPALILSPVGQQPTTP